jgi:hypothetical protein
MLLLGPLSGVPIVTLTLKQTHLVFHFSLKSLEVKITLTYCALVKISTMCAPVWITSMSCAWARLNHTQRAQSSSLESKKEGCEVPLGTGTVEGPPGLLLEMILLF